MCANGDGLIPFAGRPRTRIQCDIHGQFVDVDTGNKSALARVRFLCKLGLRRGLVYWKAYAERERERLCAIKKMYNCRIIRGRRLSNDMFAHVEVGPDGNWIWSSNEQARLTSPDWE